MSKLAVPSNEKGSDGSGFCVWNKGTSTVGSGLEAKAWASDVPLVVGDVVVRAVSGRFFLHCITRFFFSASTSYYRWASISFASLPRLMQEAVGVDF